VPYYHAWRHTSIACSELKAYSWHHLVLEFQRTSTPKVNFLAVTINGAKHYFNKLYAPRSSSANEINVAFQMDGNFKQQPYNVWLDNVTLVAY